MAIDTIKATAILDGAIGTADLADDAVTNAKIATGVSAAKLTGALPAIDGSSLTGVDPADGSITTAKLADDAVTAGKLDVGQIGGRRNIAYNGAMTVWQRGTSADTASTGDYMCDRWLVGHTGLDGNVDWDQETASTPDGFGYALKVSTDASETSLGAADNLTIQQRFEGQDLQQLLKGTSGAKSLTLSFWVKSSVASTYTAELNDGDNTRVIGKSYTITSADTWEFKTITFEGDTTGAFDNDNALSLYLIFWIDGGSDFTSGTFSTSWQGTDSTERLYDTTGWLESTTPTFYITGVQLEVGSAATPFEHRSYGEELALCQRYFQYAGGCVGRITSSSAAEIFQMLSPPMRATPTAALVDGTNALLEPGIAYRSITGISVTGSVNNENAVLLAPSGFSGTTGNVVGITGKNGISFLAEL